MRFGRVVRNGVFVAIDAKHTCASKKRMAKYKKLAKFNMKEVGHRGRAQTENLAAGLTVQYKGSQNKGLHCTQMVSWFPVF